MSKDEQAERKAVKTTAIIRILNFIDFSYRNLFFIKSNCNLIKFRTHLNKTQG